MWTGDLDRFFRVSAKTGSSNYLRSREEQRGLDPQRGGLELLEATGNGSCLVVIKLIDSRL